MTSAPPPASAEVGPTAGALRVVLFPVDDPYVDAVLPDGVLRVGTPTPEGAAARADPWLDPAHLADHAAEIDVLHLHAGLGEPAASGLEGWSETVRRLGVPLVVTVHELGDAQDPPLAAVLGTAEVVLTLTPGAADEIAERFGRTAIVVAHPTVAEADEDLGAERGLVGFRLDPPSAARRDQVALVRAALSGAVSGGGRLRLLVAEHDVPGLDPELRTLAASGDVELVPFLTKEWPAALQQLHVAVLPERCGSHSRDLEICRDVGTRVVAPHCGWFADQWSDVVAYGYDEHGNVDAVSLSAAVSAALTRPMPRAADRGWRFEQREAVRRVHAEVYAQVAGDRQRWS